MSLRTRHVRNAVIAVRSTLDKAESLKAIPASSKNDASASRRVQTICTLISNYAKAECVLVRWLLVARNRACKTSLLIHLLRFRSAKDQAHNPGNDRSNDPEDKKEHGDTCQNGQDRWAIRRTRAIVTGARRTSA